VISVNDDYTLTVSVTAVVVSTGAGASSTLVFFWQLTVISARLATIKITSNFFILLSFVIILKILSTQTNVHNFNIVKGKNKGKLSDLLK